MFLSDFISSSEGGLSSGKGIVDLLYSSLSFRLMCVNFGRIYSSGGGVGCLGLLGLFLVLVMVDLANLGLGSQQSDSDSDSDSDSPPDSGSDSGSGIRLGLVFRTRVGLGSCFRMGLLGLGFGFW